MPTSASGKPSPPGGYEYQHGFSKMHAAQMYDVEGRTSKAKKALAVMADALGPLSRLKLLDLGCSTGLLTRVYGESFGEVIGIDIDKEAVDFANRKNTHQNVFFRLTDGMQLDFPDDTFDVVTCTQIYEHVPDDFRLMAEIRRVLRPGGACFFSAGNRLILVEKHYNLPLLSVVPKPVGHLYVRLLGRSNKYYENHRTLWGLKKLVQGFEVIDYTRRVVAEPERYFATDMLKPGSLKQRLGLILLDYAYWLCPNYIWVLRKPIASASDPAASSYSVEGGR